MGRRVRKLPKVLIGAPKRLFTSFLSGDVRYRPDEPDCSRHFSDVSEKCLAASIRIPEYVVCRTKCSELCRESPVALRIECSPDALSNSSAVFRMNRPRELRVTYGAGRRQAERFL